MEISRLFLPDEPLSGNESPLTPPITFVVAQTNHNLVIAPDNTRHQQINVPGGTSLRESNILPRTHYFETIHSGDGSNPNRMDFFLTAHQGLKGTSKPLLYRCLVNDDSVTAPLDRDALRRVTYVRVVQSDAAASFAFSVSQLFPCPFSLTASELPVRHSKQGDP